MPRLRRLSARGIVRLQRGFGFEVISIRGSHAKLVRVRPSGRREILIVPMHRELTAGTTHAVYRQANRFVPVDELRPGFFTE